LSFKITHWGVARPLPVVSGWGKMDSTELGKAVWALRVMQVRIRPRFGWLEASFLGLVLLALGIRLWELDRRVIHYDEAIHVYYAWRLSNLEEYIHAPWMHGPFQIEFTALIFRLFGDTDFTARLGYVLFGTALVGLPYFLRDYLGRLGALLAGMMLAYLRPCSTSAVSGERTLSWLSGPPPCWY
jgi:hypothetical protein